MRRASLPLAVVAAALFLLLLPGELSAQCSLCRTALAGQEGLAAAFRHAILFLLVVPFAIVGVVAVLLMRARRGLGRQA